jgi:hypothetical protein
MTAAIKCLSASYRIIIKLLVANVIKFFEMPSMHTANCAIGLYAVLKIRPCGTEEDYIASQKRINLFF